MVTMTVRALGNLHCEAVHGPSGAVIQTDAPVDVGGEASQFSPTDLVGVALLTCILTTMGLVANKLNVNLAGATGTVEKTMNNEKPRRIAQLTIVIDIPLSPDDATKERLEHAAHNCPVHHSLCDDVVKDVTINWIG